MGEHQRSYFFTIVIDDRVRNRLPVFRQKILTGGVKRTTSGPRFGGGNGSVRTSSRAGMESPYQLPKPDAGPAVAKDGPSRRVTLVEMNTGVNRAAPLLTIAQDELQHRGAASTSIAAL